MYIITFKYYYNYQQQLLQCSVSNDPLEMLMLNKSLQHYNCFTDVTFNQFNAYLHNKYYF